MIAIMQVLVVAILICIGYFLAKKDIFTQKTGKDLSYLLINIVTPALIINSFQIEYTEEKLGSIISAFILAVLSYIVVILFAYIYCGRGEKNKIERLSVIFSNSGFMGIPLVAGIYGEEAVLYASIMVIVFNVLFWSYGIADIRGRFSFESFKKILLSPTILSVFVGLFFFLSRLSIPEPFSSVLKHLSNLNTPIAMLVAGISISKSNIMDIIKNKKVYKILLGKLILAPVIVALAFMPMPVSPFIKSVIAIQVACPSATIVGISALEYIGENKTATEYFTLTTISSIITIPIIKMICDMLF